MAFFGVKNHTLDAKKRLFIPAKYREGLGESFILLFLPENECIFAYPSAVWDDICEEIIESDNLDMQRYIFKSALTVDIDKQGRITIDQDFCEGAGLKKEVVVAGAGKRVEIWDSERYGKAMERAAAASHTYPRIRF